MSAVEAGPSMNAFQSQSTWIEATRQPVSRRSASHELGELQPFTPYWASLDATWTDARSLKLTAALSSYHSASSATRHTVREASDPNSAAGVPEPEQPVVPSLGTYQFG